MTKRGQLTDEAKDKLAELYNIKPEEVEKPHLRFLPYLCDCAMNNRAVDVRVLSGQEIKLLNELCIAKHVTEVEPVRFSRPFYDKMCDVLYDTYANSEHA